MSRIERVNRLPGIIDVEHVSFYALFDVEVPEHDKLVAEYAVEYSQESRLDPRRASAFFDAVNAPPGPIHAFESSIALQIEHATVSRAVLRIPGPIDVTNIVGAIRDKLSHRNVYHEYMVLPKVAALHDFLRPDPVRETWTINPVGAVPSFKRNLDRCALCHEPCLPSVAVAWDAFMAKPQPRNKEPMHVFHVCCAAYMAILGFPVCPCAATSIHDGLCHDAFES